MQLSVIAFCKNKTCIDEGNMCTYKLRHSSMTYFSMYVILNSMLGVLPVAECTPVFSGDSGA